MLKAERSFRNRIITDATTMNKSFVGEIHQVIDEQPIITIQVCITAVTGPFFMFILVKVRDK
ncbi:hypothetical protein D3C85_1889280 [compost metagenome]